MNLAQLREWIDLQSLAPYDAASIDGYINQAYLELAVAYDWPWTETTTTFDHVSGTANYTLPTDMNRLRAVIYSGQGGESQPTRTSFESVLRRFGTEVGESDIPAEYYRQGSDLIFVPTPSGTQEVILLYYARPELLVADEDEPLFDAAFHVYLADKAMALYFESEESFQHADVYNVRSVSTLMQLMSFYDVQLPPERLIVGGGIRGLRYPPFVGWDTTSGI